MFNWQFQDWILCYTTNGEVNCKNKFTSFTNANEFYHNDIKPNKTLIFHCSTIIPVFKFIPFWIQEKYANYYFNKTIINYFLAGTKSKEITFDKLLLKD